jgi:hypothetical protein
MARNRRDDYDDEDDDYEDERPARRRPAPRQSAARPPNNTAVKVIAILGGVFALVVLVCGGISVYVYMSIARGVNEAQQRMLAEAKAREAAAAKAQPPAPVPGWMADEKVTDKGMAKEAGLDFIGYLRDGRFAPAAGMMTNDLRETESVDTLSRHAATNQQILSWPRLHGLRDRTPFGPKEGTTFRFELGTPWGDIPLTMVKQGDRWLVSSVTFPK